MKNSSNMLRNIFWGFAIIGTILLVIYSLTTGLPVGTLFTYVAVWAVLLLVVGILVFFVPYVKQGKELDALTKLLLEDKDPEAYIRALQSFIKAHPTGMIFQVAQLNLAVAYCDTREHLKAAEEMKKINPASLAIANRNVYWAYLALICFYNGDSARGISIMDKHGKQIQQDFRLKDLGPVPYIIGVFYNIAKQQRKEAREIYAKARRKYTDERYAADFDYLKRKYGF